MLSFDPTDTLNEINNTKCEQKNKGQLQNNFQDSFQVNLDLLVLHNADEVLLECRCVVVAVKAAGVLLCRRDGGEVVVCLPSKERRSKNLDNR